VKIVEHQEKFKNLDIGLCADAQPALLKMKKSEKTEAIEKIAI
jgi:hypothetical protein